MSSPRFTKAVGPHENPSLYYPGDTITFYKENITPNIRFQIFNPNDEKVVDIPLRSTGDFTTRWKVPNDIAPGRWWVAKLVRNNQRLSRVFFEIQEKQNPITPTPTPRFTRIEPDQPSQGDRVDIFYRDMPTGTVFELENPDREVIKWWTRPTLPDDHLRWHTRTDQPVGTWGVHATRGKGGERIATFWFGLFAADEPEPEPEPEPKPEPEPDPLDPADITRIDPLPRYQGDTITFTKENIAPNTRLQVFSPLPDRKIHVNIPLATGDTSTEWYTHTDTPAGWWLAKLVQNGREITRHLFEIRERRVEPEPDPAQKEFYVFSFGFKTIFPDWLGKLENAFDAIKNVFARITGWEFEKAYKHEDKIKVYAYKTSNNPAPASVVLLLLAGITSAFLLAGIIITSYKITRYTKKWEEEKETGDEEERGVEEIIEDVLDCPELTDDQKQEIIDIIRGFIDPDQPIPTPDVPIPEPDVPEPEPELVPDIKNYKINIEISSLLPGFIIGWGLEKLNDQIIAGINTVLSVHAPGWSLYDINRTENLLTLKLQKHGSITIAALLPLIISKLKYILPLFGIAITGYVAKEMTEDWKEVKIKEVEETLSRDEIINAILEHPDLTEDQKAELISKLLEVPEPEPEKPWIPGLPDMPTNATLIIGIIIIIIILIFLLKR